MRSKPSALEIVLPATSANLGPGFDSLAIAFDLYLKIEARTADDFSFHASGRDTSIYQEGSNNLVLETYQDVLHRQQRPVVPLAMTIGNQIPIGKGCGSSAAARLAGIVLAVHFGDLSWSGQQILEEAARLEAHPDNVAACWFGGLVIAKWGEGEGTSGHKRVHAAQITPAARWRFMLVVPPNRLATEAARKVLPERYSAADAIANVQNAMLVVAAFMQGREELFELALNDRFHEPYRASLCPLLEPMRALAGKAGILGAALSGSGPSVLLVLDAHTAEWEIKETVAAAVAQAGLSAELICTTIGEGARIQELHPAHQGEHQ